MNDNRIKTPDSIKYNKSCPDFVCLKDGTLFGDYRYCQLSTVCRQADYVNGKPVPMETHYCKVVDPTTNQVAYWEYYCTGKHDCRVREERLDGDEKVS